MSKYSVKKPFTVLVGVVLVLVLGVVSLMRMPTDLLPTINLPYLMVVTTYPGASPEKVEGELTAPLEAALGTVNGVESVSSTSNENYSMIMLEFDENTDMDSAMVKASAAVNQLADSLPDLAGTPMLLELSADMMATQYVAVDHEDMDIYELSAYAEEQIIPAVERVNGVASVSAAGLVEKTVEVTLNQDKIDKVNDKLLVKISDRLAEAEQELDKAEKQVADGKSALDDAQAQLDSGKSELDGQKQSITDQLTEAIRQLNDAIPALEEQIGGLEGKISETSAKLEAAKVDASRLESPDIGGSGAAVIDKAQAIESDLARFVDQQGDFNAALGGLKALLAQLDPDGYREEQMPASLEEALNDRAKRAAMLESIRRAQAALAPAVTQLQSTAAALAAQIEAAEDEAQKAALQAQLDAVNGQLAPLLEAQNLLQAAETLLQAMTRADEAEDAARAALAEADAAAKQLVTDLQSQLNELNAQLDAARTMLDKLNTQRGSMETVLQGLVENPLDTGLAGMASSLLFSGVDAQLSLGQFRLDSGRTQLDAGAEQLKAAREEYEAAREEALKSANMDQLLNMATLAQILGAQNFSMPAGYIQDGEDRYMLKVGDTFETVEELEGALLCSIDGIGDVRLSDVADIRITDNADDTYAKVDKNQAVLLSIYKGSTSSTSEVSDNCNKKIAELMADDPGLHLTTIMDQGDYIRLIIDNVLSNLLWGAVLAIIVLVFFLKDARPTAVVAVSIPLSVLFAIVLMYFSGITLNMISLSGLALGIGMLVDNSIVVIENIYRLRSRGVPAARAAVQGARQVAGAIASSTLTTICVFLPVVFTEGLTRTLLTDMALTITFSLVASLAVALTVVPAAGSTILKKTKEIRHPWFDRVLTVYDKALRAALRVKAVPLALAVALLAGSMGLLFRKGLVLMPDISSNQLSVSLKLPEDTPDADAFAAADAAMDRMMAVEGVQTVGAMSSAGTAGAVAGMSAMAGAGSNTSYTFYILLDEASGRSQAEVEQQILRDTADLGAEVTVGGGASDMSALMSSGVEVNIYGNDLDDLLAASDQVAELMAGVEGITEISNGQETGDPEVRVVVDKDKAMRLGLTVAQIYAELAKALTTDTTSTSLTVGEETYTVSIVDTTRTPDLDSIFGYEFETTSTNEDGETVKQTHTLGEFASRADAPGVASIRRENLARYITVTSSTMEGYNTTQLARQVQQKLDALELPGGCTAEIGGETTQVDDMMMQMGEMMALALILIYLVMVAQFQSLLSPFIVLFTIPLAFTGGAIGLILAGEPVSLMSLMGFLVLMGVVVNNGIVFVDYTNQLRIGGLSRREALVATGRTRMRPILMTTLTTVLAMITMLFSSDAGSELGRGMAIVIVGGLLYATLMTLFIVPVIYDILFKKEPSNVDIGDEGMDDLPDDAAEYAASLGLKLAPAGSAPADPPPQEDLFPDFPIEK